MARCVKLHPAEGTVKLYAQFDATILEPASIPTKTNSSVLMSPGLYSPGGALYLCVAGVVCKQDTSVTKARLEIPMQLKCMQTRARAGLEPKSPRRADQLQAKPHLVRDKEKSSKEHVHLQCIKYQIATYNHLAASLAGGLSPPSLGCTWTVFP